MPLATPKEKESHEQFIQRCMKDEVMKREFPKAMTRYAVCEKQWEDKNK